MFDQIGNPEDTGSHAQDDEVIGPLGAELKKGGCSRSFHCLDKDSDGCAQCICVFKTKPHDFSRRHGDQSEIDTADPEPEAEVAYPCAAQGCEAVSYTHL